MTAAVIVSTARTPIGRAFRGAFNHTKSPTLAGHAIKHAVRRAHIEGAEVDDVVLGTAMPAGTAGMNIGRLAALAAGLGDSVPGQTVDRQCASGLMAIAIAAKQILVDGMRIVVGGGQENISALNTPYGEWVNREEDDALIQVAKYAYVPMLHTAEFVSKKHQISREQQDVYALASQQRTAAAQAAGRLDAEIVSLTTRMAVTDKDTKAVSFELVTLAKDEGNRPQTTLAGLHALKPVLDGGVITAGNASQLSDGCNNRTRRKRH